MVKARARLVRSSTSALVVEALCSIRCCSQHQIREASYDFLASALASPFGAQRLLELNCAPVASSRVQLTC